MKKEGIEQKLSKNDITPMKGRVSVMVKSWPAQTEEGLFVGTSNVIRNELYAAEAVKGANVDEGDVIITSMYSGYHINVKEGHLKIINETDTLMYKTKKQMDKDKSFQPTTFMPGTNYMLVKINPNAEKITEAGIVFNVGTGGENSKNDSVVDIAEIVSIGNTQEIQGMANISDRLKPGVKVIIDKFVGIPMNQNNANPKFIYKIMYYFDAVAIIE